MKTPSPASLESLHGIEKLVAVVARLRDPQEGCPWDLKQTHASLRPYMLEEAYEAVEAINTGDPALLREELGDVLLQVVLHSQLAKDAGTFDFAQVCEMISDKLVRRHPHVFSTVTADDAETVVLNWEAIKRAEKGETEKPESVLKGVNKSQPALSRALETSQKAVKVGFEWPNFESLWECVMSEYAEFRAEAAALTEHPERLSAAEKSTLRDRLELEMGDIFFAGVNLARHFDLDAEIALSRATDKFTRRFQAMEGLIEKRFGAGHDLKTLDFETWDQLWREAKDLTSAGETPAAS